MAGTRGSGARSASAAAKSGPVIDTSQIDVAGLGEKEFPAGAGYRILISAAAHESVWKHADQSVEEARVAGRGIVEVGGILIGNVFKDADGPYLEISAAIVGEHTNNQGTQMTFTPETWDHVTKVKETRFPNDKIVGWYHTHPDFGVFLSDMDKFTHRQFFSPPWTTAFVVDPVRKTEGFFVWSGGETVETSEYWVGQQRRNRIVVVGQPADRTAMDSSPKPESAISRATFALCAVLGLLALLVVFGYVYTREIVHSDVERQVIGALENQKQALAATVNELGALRQTTDASLAKASDAQALAAKQIQDVAERLKRLYLSNQELQAQLTGNQQLLDELQKSVNQASGGQPAATGGRSGATGQPAPAQPKSPAATPPKPAAAPKTNGAKL
jgi:proteasome lid subunit RPN8/RPN11